MWILNNMRLYIIYMGLLMKSLSRIFAKSLSIFSPTSIILSLSLIYIVEYNILNYVICISTYMECAINNN